MQKPGFLSAPEVVMFGPDVLGQQDTGSHSTSFFPPPPSPKDTRAPSGCGVLAQLHLTPWESDAGGQGGGRDRMEEEVCGAHPLLSIPCSCCRHACPFRGRHTSPPASATLWLRPRRRASHRKFRDTKAQFMPYPASRVEVRRVLSSPHRGFWLAVLPCLAGSVNPPRARLFPPRSAPISLEPAGLALWSCRFWASYVLLQFAHLQEDRKLLLLQQQRTLRKAKGGALTAAEKQHLQQRWDAYWSGLLVNACNLPLSLHWSVQGGLIKNPVLVDILGFIAALASFRIATVRALQRNSAYTRQEFYILILTPHLVAQISLDDSKHAGAAIAGSSDLEAIHTRQEFYFLQVSFTAATIDLRRRHLGS
ncbi:hypothetical protein B0H14DRAFT_3781988 [Mycena olivaceomarginata]|nr:hypothetical protein B0H14DRAFT_3781988 [Mycena olivaceomarginata]